MTETISKDLNLTHNDIANSNIVSLAATLLVRLTAGTACDRFGARWTFAAVLMLGAIPTALAGTVTNARELFALRLFIGILGGSFIPCQVWTTGFFDKSVVGTANSLTAGLGNAGSGVTYFVSQLPSDWSSAQILTVGRQVMPAIVNSLVNRQHTTPHVAWRIAFIVPFILITATAVIMILTCPDTPTGRWSARARDVQRHLDMRDTFFSTVDQSKDNALSIDSAGHSSDTVKLNSRRAHGHGADAQTQEDDLLAAASWELVEKPTVHGSTVAVSSWPIITLCVVYFCTFGLELSVNSVLGAYYAKNFPRLGETGSGSWVRHFPQQWCELLTLRLCRQLCLAF